VGFLLGKKTNPYMMRATDELKSKENGNYRIKKDV
jgi:hypothetical protein